MTFITTLGGSSGIINSFPFIAVAGWRVVKADIGLQGNTASSTVFSRRTRRITGTDSFGRQRATKFSVLAFEIIAVRFHFQAGAANGYTVRANGNAVVIGSLFGVAEVEINERLNMFALTKLVHSHRIMSGVQKQLVEIQGRSVGAETKECFAKTM